MKIALDFNYLDQILGRMVNYGPARARREAGSEDFTMIVTAFLGILVVFCLLLSMLEKPPAIGR